MFEFFSKRYEFVRIFLSVDNLDQLRELCLRESGDERKVVDLGLAAIPNSDEDVEAVSLTKVKPAALIDGYNFLTGKTLFTCSPEEHEQYIKSFPLEIVGQRKWIVTQEATVKAETERFVREWVQAQPGGGKEPVDFRNLTFDLVFAILSRTVLGVGRDPEQQADFEAMAGHLNRYLLYQIPPIMPSYFAARKRWFARVDKIIADRQAEKAAKGDAFEGIDLLSTLLKMNHTMDDLTCRSMSQAYWAGQFTHSSVLAGAIFHTGRSPEVRDYLRADVAGRALNVAKEALRMHPGAPIYDRGVPKGQPIKTPSGHVFEPGSRPFVCPHIIGTDPKYWPDPLKFDPKRFEGHEGFQSKAFVPFGYAPEKGGRACTGRYYALEVLPWLIGTIFDKFDVEVLSDKITFTEYAACAYSFAPLMAKITPRATA